ncbi:TetR/AcrR family transcriptional regulator [Microbacterium forte]
MVQYAKTAAVRQGIIDACLTIFGESGFHGASMAEIARRAGISHTGLLHHFSRKEDLLTAVLSMQDQRSADFLARNSALDTGADPLDVLRGMARTLIERDQRIGLVELSAVLTGEATAAGHPAHEYFTTRYRNVRSFMTRLFSRLGDEGRLSTHLPPAHLAAITIAAMDGLHTQWLFDRTAIDVDACVSELMAAFVPELKTAPPE